MKVLGICASLRKLGNSELILKEMLLAFPESYEKQLVRTTDLNILPCKACYACLPENKACVLNDDFNFLLQQIKNADIILIASPVYFLGIHNSIKMIQDRLISVFNKGSSFSGKKCLLALSYGIEGWEGAAFSQLNAFAHFLHLKIYGSLMLNAAKPGEAVMDKNLAKIKDFMAQFLSGKEKINPREDIVTCPGCGSDLLQFSQAGEIRCVYCNLQGIMKNREERIIAAFPISKERRFSVKEMQNHAQHLEEIKNGYMEKRQEFNEIRKPYRQYDMFWTLPSPNKES